MEKLGSLCVCVCVCVCVSAYVCQMIHSMGIPLLSVGLVWNLSSALMFVWVWGEQKEKREWKTNRNGELKILRTCLGTSTHNLCVSFTLYHFNKQEYFITLRSFLPSLDFESGANKVSLGDFKQPPHRNGHSTKCPIETCERAQGALSYNKLLFYHRRTGSQTYLE